MGFNSNKTILFQRLNCTLPSGSVTVISGYNSSGKTSLCSSLMGLIEPIKGNILFNNIDIKNYNIKYLRRNISYVPQEIDLFNMSIKDNIKINLDSSSSNYNNDGFLIKVIKMIGLDSFINNLTDGLDAQVKDNGKNIPRGIKKRIALARAIISDGKIVILDEPTSALDLDGLNKLYKILNDFRALKKTIIIASHDQNIIKSAGIIIDLSVKPIPRIGVRKKIKMLSVKEEKELKKIEKKEESFFFFFSFFIFLILGAVSIVVYYFNNTSLNIISETKGIVVPSSKVKVIQHLEGGIIKKIYVNIGDIVKKNDILLELEPVKTLADFSEIEKRITTLSINILRLRAESDNKKLIFPEDMKIDYPNLVNDALQLFQVRKNKNKALLEEQEKILENEKNSLKLLEEQVQISKSLLEEQLTNRLKHLDLLKERNAVLSKIESSVSSIKKNKGDL